MTTLSEIDALLRVSVQRINEAVEFFINVKNGGDDQTVSNGTEELPTIAKFLKDANDEISLALGDFLQAVADVGAARDLAEASAQLALAIANRYTDTTAGLNNTSGTGETNRFFSTPSPEPDESGIIYLNDNGTAVESARTPGPNPAVSAAPNLIFDPFNLNSDETDPRWNIVSGTITYLPSDSNNPYGLTSVGLNATFAGKDKDVSALLDGLDAGDSFSVGALAYIPSGTSARLDIRQRDASSQLSAHTGATVAGADANALLTVNGVPLNAAAELLRNYIGRTAGSGQVKLHAMWLVKGDAAGTTPPFIADDTAEARIQSVEAWIAANAADIAEQGERINQAQPNLIPDARNRYTQPDQEYGGRARWATAGATLTQIDPDPSNPFDTPTVRVDGTFGGPVLYMDDLQELGIEIGDVLSYAIRGLAASGNFRVVIQYRGAGGSLIGSNVNGGTKTFSGSEQIITVLSSTIPALTDHINVHVQRTSGSAAFDIYEKWAQTVAVFSAAEAPLPGFDGAVQAGLDFLGEVDPVVEKARVDTISAEQTEHIRVTQFAPPNSVGRISQGQSNSRGAGSSATLSSTSIDSGAQMFENNTYAALVPLNEPATGNTVQDTGAGETHASANVWTYRRLAADREVTGPHIIHGHAGVGGNNITALRKGGATGAYEDALVQVAAMQAARPTLDHIDVVWIQGESNMSNAQGVYSAAMIGLVDEWNADMRALGFVRPSVFFCPQPSSWTDFGLATSPYPQELIDAAIARPDLIVLSGPMYVYPHDTGGVHLDEEGHFAQGEKLAQAQFEWYYNHRRTALHMRNAYREGNEVFVDFGVFAPPIQVNVTDTTAAIANSGFEYDVDGSPFTITAVAVETPTQIKLTLSGTPVGTTETVRIAWTGVANNDAGPTTGPRSNICDSDPFISARGTQDMRNYALSQEMEVLV